MKKIVFILLTIFAFNLSAQEDCACEVELFQYEGVECTLRAKRGKGCATGPNVSHTFTLPNGNTINFWYITSLEPGTYCYTFVDNNGCEASDCITLDENCEETCQPNWETVLSGQMFIYLNSWNPGNCWLGAGGFISIFADRCCEDVSNKFIEAKLSQTITNITTGQVLYNNTSTEQTSNNRDRFQLEARISYCNKVNVGDVIRYDGSVSITDWGGCQYNGPTEYSNTDFYTITASDMSCCGK